MSDIRVKRVSGGSVYLPGTTGNYLSVPDEAALGITGDMDIRVKVALGDWKPAGLAPGRLVSKWNTGTRQCSYMFGIAGASTGFLRLAWSVDGGGTGASIRTVPATDAPTVSVGEALWLRATLDADDGGVYKVDFYTSPDGSVWTKLGDTVVGTEPASVFASNQSVDIGALSSAAHYALGTFHRAIIKNGIDGPTVLDADCGVLGDASQRAFTARTGQTVTIHGTGVTVNPGTGFWEQVYPEPVRPAAPVVTGAPGNGSVTLKWGHSLVPTLTHYDVEVDGAITRYALADLTAATMTRTNLCANPSLEVDVTGWAKSNAGSNVSVTTEQALVGTKSLKFERLSTGSTTAAVYTASVTEGTTYTGAMTVRGLSGVRADLLWVDSGGATVSPTSVGDSAVGTGWERLTATGVAPAGAVTVRLRTFAPAAVVAGVGYIDCATLEEGVTPGSFFDGGYADPSIPSPVTAWAGTAGSSTSTLQYAGYSKTITGLTNGTSYTFRVRAVTANGSGPWSTPVTVAPQARGTATGGTIAEYTESGVQYRSHTFLSGGDFVVSDGGLVDVEALVVAGGGGGGYSRGGGGGAGGLKVTTKAPFSDGTYPVVVGAGGIGGVKYPAVLSPTNGGDSSFGGVSVTGGGHGGDVNGTIPNGEPGAAGGSGGGGAFNNGTISHAGGAGIAGQGNNGGSSGPAVNDPRNTGGGGGAGGVGVSGSVARPDGGPGVSNTFRDGTTRWYAGGGGGGSGRSQGDTYAYVTYGPGNGGSGVGGNGAQGSEGTAYATAGVDGTGSGGGGGTGGGTDAASSRSGKNGGSGVVIIRYPIG